MSYGEERYLGGGLFGGTIINLKPRLRALKVHLRRKDKIAGVLLLIIGIIMTIFVAVFSTVAFLIIFQGSWLTRTIGSNFYYIGPYVFLPLFVLLGVSGLAILIFEARFWAIKDRAPLRLMNSTNRQLRIYLNEIDIGEVYPGTEIDNKKVLAGSNSYMIEAKDASGNILYSKELNLDELDAIDWNVKID